MASFRKLVDKKPMGKQMAQADTDDGPAGMIARKKKETDDAMEATAGGDTRKKRDDKDPKPGTEAYIKRRDKQGKEDLARMRPRGA